MLKEKERLRKRAYRAELRRNTLALLGGKCERCGETDERCLQVDHRHGGGRVERLALGAGWRVYERCLKEGLCARERYALLCANCNSRKYYENSEFLLNRVVSPERENNKRRWRKLRSMVMAVLGGACAICGETDSRVLQVDHIHGNGAHERRTLWRCGVYRKIISLGEAARAEYQCLCANCHWRKSRDLGEIGRHKIDGAGAGAVALSLPLGYNNTEHESGHGSSIECGASEV